MTCYQDFKGLVDSDKFPETYEVEEANMTAIKEGCQEAQKALLEAYEKVSESLESYIKKLDEVKKANEKGTDQKDIKQVAKSELDVFKKYEISLEDEGCSESEKHCEKGNDAFEETNIEISEDDNLLVGKV